MKVFMRLFQATCVLLLLALCCYAQSPLGTVTGIATDASTAPVPSATITLINEGTDIKVESNSNQSGVYSFPNLTPGKYHIAANAKGFRPFETPVFAVAAYQTVRQEIRFEVESASSEVTVSEAIAPVIQVDSPSINNRLSSKQILELPTN